MEIEVECVECGSRLPSVAVRDPLATRTPCPNCGSTARRFRQQSHLIISNAEPALGRGEAFDATVVTASASGSATGAGHAHGTVTKRVAECHLTVLADRTESGGLLVRLVDEQNARDLAGLYVGEVGDDDDIALNLAVDVLDLMGGSA
jgi:predicted RNA-binding Zn-ribbon protein involved in translation (DUF1610 family)